MIETITEWGFDIEIEYHQTKANEGIKGIKDEIITSTELFTIWYIYKLLTGENPLPLGDGMKSALLHADVNGALNILRKSSVVSLQTLYSRGEVDTPIRIRIA